MVTPGTRFGPYEIGAQIGAGGMGEVYCATDTTLGRQVAIKVLPEALTRDADRMARFDLEARALASLNHPNIATIHGLEKADGRPALIMELVEGPTLAERIAQGAMPLDEVLPVAQQIAEALEAAHQQGIIHRDLKPANVKVRPDGAVKVLDFGLAKVYSSDAPAASGIALTHSPTLTSPAAMTGVGVILGTAAYMAPEQARGRPVTKATDIWAFGCVLYEMLTGRAVFAGDNVTDVIAAVVRGDPDWSLLPASTPLSLRTLLRRCLDKEPRRRWQDAASLRIGVEEAPSDALRAGDAVAPRARNDRSPRAIAATVLAAAVLTAATMWSFRPAAPEMRVTRTEVPVTPARHVNVSLGPRGTRPLRTAMALSANGQTLVFVAGDERQSQLYVRRMDRLDASPIPGTEGADSPFLDPTGQWVGFWQRVAGPVGLGDLKKVSVNGGAIVTICRTGYLAGASWGSHGRIVFANHEGEGLWHVDEDGGNPEPLTSINQATGESAHRLPYVLPDGKAVIFTIQKSPSGFDDAEIVVRSFATGAQKPLVKGAADARYIETGHLLYAQQGSLMAQPFDVARLEITGGPVGVLQNVMHDVNTTLRVGNSGAAQFTVSATGTLAYLPGGVRAESVKIPYWMDRRGMAQRVPLSQPTWAFGRISPDGTQVLFHDRNRMVVYDIKRGTVNPLGSDASNVAIWNPVTQRITYTSPRTREMLIVPYDSSGPAERLPTTELGVPVAWSPDGNTLVYVKPDSTQASTESVWLLSLDGSKSKAQPFRVPEARHLSFSPDGKYVAYQAAFGRDRAEVYVEPFPGPGPRVTISSNGGSGPAWAGRELFFVEPAQRGGAAKMMVVDVTLGATFAAGSARPLFEFDSNVYRAGAAPLRRYDVTPDGQRFLMFEDRDATEPPLTHIVLVQNWFEEIRRAFQARK